MDFLQCFALRAAQTAASADILCRFSLNKNKIKSPRQKSCDYIKTFFYKVSHSFLKVYEYRGSLYFLVILNSNLAAKGFHRVKPVMAGKSPAVG